MKIGIIGLPQTGKKTLFKLLVGAAALDKHVDQRAVVRGVADVQDDRFDRLLEIYEPQKQTRARLEVSLLPKIEENVVAQGNIFKDMGEVEAFCHLVRVFDDASVYHLWGGPDPAREIEFVNSELLLHDQLFVEKRLKRIEANLQKVKTEEQQKERVLLLKFQEWLEQERPLRLLELSREEERIISSYPILTRRRMIVALNIAESDIGHEELTAGLKERFQGIDVSFVRIAVQAESDISELETEAERAEFMEEVGIEEAALHALTRKCIEALGLSSFFTAAKSELRQWFVRSGSLAPQAAGIIHSDMERGFIRAEVVKYDDIVEFGSEEAVKEAGKYYVKGKDYAVEDGDILGILFNV